MDHRRFGLETRRRYLFYKCLYIAQWSITLVILYILNKYPDAAKLSLWDMTSFPSSLYTRRNMKDETKDDTGNDIDFFHWQPSSIELVIRSGLWIPVCCLPLLCQRASQRSYTDTDYVDVFGNLWSPELSSTEVWPSAQHMNVLLLERISLDDFLLFPMHLFMILFCLDFVTELCNMPRGHCNTHHLPCFSKVIHCTGCVSFAGYVK